MATLNKQLLLELANDQIKEATIEGVILFSPTVVSVNQIKFPSQTFVVVPGSCFSCNLSLCIGQDVHNIPTHSWRML